MRNKILYVLLIVAVILAGVHVAVNTPWVAQAVITRLFASKPGIVVKDVRIGRQDFSFPGRLEWRDVNIVLVAGGKKFSLQAPQVVVTGLQTILGEQRYLIAAGKMAVRYDIGQAKGVAADIVIDQGVVSGPVSAEALSWDKIEAGESTGFLSINAGGIELRAVRLKAYGGQVTGKVAVPAGKAVAYAADILIENLDVAGLADVNAQVAEQLNGRVSGAVKLEGGAKTLRFLDTDLGMPAGGRISAALLSALTQYLPQSREKQRLDLLIRNGGKLAMEGFSFTIKGGDRGHYAGELHLKSREVNLELNLTHEINTDGTVDALLGYWQKILK